MTRADLDHFWDEGEGDPWRLHHIYDDGEEVTDQPTEKQQRHFMIQGTKFYKGLLDPPLQSPAGRRRIRDRVQWTQEQLADELVDRSGLHVTRQMVSRWERPVGYGPGDVRLPGREPLGERRRAYAELLEVLKRMPPATTKQSSRL
jgi:hypothetical protein